MLIAFYIFYQTYSEEKHRAPGGVDEMRERFHGYGAFELITLDQLHVQWGTPLGTDPPAILATLDKGPHRVTRSVLTDGTIVLQERIHSHGAWYVVP
jgi:hypothetical protein